MRSANKQSARFITVEGIEGAGKSTIMKTLHKVLGQRGIDHVLTREPGGTPLAESIRQNLLHTEGEVVHESTELLLMFASRAQHVHELILPSLEMGRWVVSDRFSDASYAYQGGGRGMSPEWIAHLEMIAHPNLRPDLTILLDIDPSLGMKRIASRHAHDRIENENLQFFRKVREAYLDRAKHSPERFVVIDANRVLSKVKHDTIDLMNKWIDQHHA